MDSSPAVANGVVYVGSLDKNLYAVDAKTGAMLWSYGMGSYVESSPAISNGVVYIGSSDGTLYALDAGKGTVLWSYATHTGNYIISSPAVANGVIYISSTPNNYHDNIDDKLYALDAGKGTVIWSATVSVDFSSPTVANGVVYVGSAVYTGNTNNNTPRGSGKLYAFDAKTGTALWNYAPGDIIESSPAVVNGVVYVGSYDGKLYAFHLPSSST